MNLTKLKKWLDNLPIFSFSNSTCITVWANDINIIERLWKEVYMNNGWDIVSPIEVKFNWRKLDWRFRIKLEKK